MESLLSASALGGQTAGGSGSSSKSGYDPEEQKEVFMKMLTAQLENQNPLDPMKNQEMTAQLAQFSSVEQQIQSNEYLKQLAQKDSSGQRMDAVSLLGRQAWMAEPTVTSRVDGQAHRFRFQLDASQSVKVEVTNADGRLVDEHSLGSQSAGTHEAQWDGTTANGLAAPAGEYTIKAYPEGKEDPEALGTQIRATVQEVRFGDNGAELGIAGGRFIPFDRVAAVSA